MRFEKQASVFRLKNFDCSQLGDRGVKKRHGPLLPNTIRGLLVGPSNCGKTNLIIGLLEDKNGLRFQNVYLYSKSLNQPKYRYLQRVLSKVKEIGFYTFGDTAQVVLPENAKPNSVFIFDDIVCENMDTVRKYFSMGRHKNVDCFFLCQSYTRVPKHLVRDNANLIFAFKQDNLNLKHMFDDHVGTDMPYEVFTRMCGDIWRAPHAYLVIDKDSPLNAGRYRRGLDTYIKFD